MKLNERMSMNLGRALIDIKTDLIILKLRFTKLTKKQGKKEIHRFVNDLKLC